VKKEAGKIKDQFAQRAATFENSAKWVIDKDLLDIHSKLAGVLPGERVLEVCCGTGVVGDRLARDGGKVVGMDISLSMLAGAKEKLHSCVNGQAEHLPFCDNTFDVVICRQAFHFLDTPQVVKEMLRVAKSGTGRIVISQIVPFGEEDSDWMCRIHRAKQPLLRNFIREQDLTELLENAGCGETVVREHCIEEPINPWLTDTFFPDSEIEKIKEMFVNSPAGYKTSHKIKCIDGNIFETMRWVVARGKKPLNTKQ
jgi:DNA gyrase subunit B